MYNWLHFNKYVESGKIYKRGLILDISLYQSIDYYKHNEVQSI
jgi:hypothetical protein